MVGTGDILNPKWLRHVREETEEKNGYLKRDNIKFIPTTEVEERTGYII